MVIQAGDHATARQHLVDSLSLNVFSSSLLALSAVALLLAKVGDAARAVELYALASKHGFVANSRWFEVVAGRHIKDAAASLPEEGVAAAQARGVARDLWETVDQLLSELQEMELSPVSESARR